MTYGEVPQEVNRDRRVGRVQDHAPVDEKPGLTEYERSRRRVSHADCQTDGPGEKRVVVTRSVVVVPLHDAGPIQRRLIRRGVSSIRLKESKELTLITTANTIGPKISAMFIPGTMAAASNCYEYTE